MPQKLTLQDLTAMLVSLILTIALCALAFTSRDVPPALTMALGSAMTWLFIRSTTNKTPAGDTTTVESTGATETTVRAVDEHITRLWSEPWPEPLIPTRSRSLNRSHGAALPSEDAVVGIWLVKE